MGKLFGTTGYSFFEYWTLGHVCFWIWAGTVSAGLRLNRTYFFLGALVAAYGWEVVETFLEQWYPELATHPESWWNRWLSDPLMCVVGLLLAWYGFDHWRSAP